MFYGAFVLAKKGPLAKVWLAAHWDKKLTKAHVFETDVESTVDSIISPQVKLALRTSGHLLLGVVRIYSRKQKYLITDLGEACAKIKMAFRPGVVDLPAEGAVASSEAITLPEIFHDFETAVADIGALDVETHTVNPSRASEITMAEDHTTTDGDMFGTEFGELGDFAGEGFGGGMADIELNRKSKSSAFADHHKTSDGIDLAVSDMTNGGATDGPAHMLPEKQQLPARLADGVDFTGEGFGDGEMVDLGALPNVSNLTVEQPPAATGDGVVPMEVDLPQGGVAPATDEQPAAAADQSTLNQGEEGFVLEPVEMTISKEKKSKRKRKLIVDTSKELTSEFIKTMLSDYDDTLQPKCFPPPTKKAVLWRSMGSCEQLFVNPTIPFMAAELINLVTRNYTRYVPTEEEEAKKRIDLGLRIDESNATNADIENPRDRTETDAIVGGGGDNTVGEVVGADIRDPAELEFAMEDFGGQGGPDLVAAGAMGLSDMDEGDPLRIIPDLPDLEEGENLAGQSNEEQQENNEPSEEFERKRWTRRTQQVFRVLDKNLASQDSVKFSSLTHKCNRKQAAARFYTCLLLAKEGAISVNQVEAYSDITIEKGPKFANAF